MTMTKVTRAKSDERLSRAVILRISREFPVRTLRDKLDDIQHYRSVLVVAVKRSIV
jgi:hypothetical protein